MEYNNNGMFDQIKTKKFLKREAPNYYSRFRDDIDMTDGTVQINHNIYKKIQEDAVRHLKQELDDYKECYENYKSNIRLMDSIINDGDAATQASLCDLIPQVRVLKRKLDNREREVGDLKFENGMCTGLIVQYIKWAKSLEKYMLVSSDENNNAAKKESAELFTVMERFLANTNTGNRVKERLNK